MSIEAQLEKLNSNLEKIVELLTPNVVTCEVNLRGHKLPAAEEVKGTPTPAAKVKAKPKVEESVATPVEQPVEKTTPPQDEVKVTLDDLATKVKTLAQLGGRDAVMGVLAGFNVIKLSELHEAKYVHMDLALAKAITKAKGE